MGTKSRKKKEFIFRNPLCCFCGGNENAVEIDHIPARTIFRDRQWPEGYEFPACLKCNRASRYEEQIIAFLSRLYPESKTEKDEIEFKKSLRDLERYNAAILIEMNPTVRQVRTAIKDYNIEVPAGMGTKDLPLLNVAGPKVNNAILNFSRKLFLALYYKHSGKILSRSSGIAVKWFSNLQLANNDFPREVIDVLNQYPKLERCNTSLEDQFSYHYVFSTCGNTCVFFATFRKTFGLLGWVKCNGADFNIPHDSIILAPYSHS